MRRRHLIAALVGLVAAGIFADDASAMYHPGMGVFMSRDPGAGGATRIGAGGPAVAGGFIPRDPTGSNQYADGMNLYQYVGGSPTSYTDPLGLWKVRRAGGKLAEAEAEAQDTISMLANHIGLESTEFRRWLTLSGGSIMTPTGRRTLAQLNETDECCPGETVQIPNTVLAYWAGELGGFGKWWVMWGSDVSTLTERGFNVPEHEGWTANGLGTEIQTATRAKELHGIFFWGHGYVGGVLTDSSENGNAAYYSDYAFWNPSYKLGLGILFACHTQSGRGQFSKGAIFWGKTGVLIPHGFHLFGPTVSSLVPPGAQGTKQ